MPPYNKAKRGGRGGGGGGRGHGHGGRGGQNANQVKGAHDVLTAMLRLLFEKQQNQIYANGVLQISNFKQCPDVASLQKSIDFNTKAFCDSLCSVIKETVVTPQFIAVEGNELTTLRFLLDAIVSNDMHTTLNGLSAANNNLKDLSFLGQLRKFENLQELKFVGNPICNDAAYVQKIRKALPSLLGIDGEAVSRPPLSLPWPVPLQRTQDMTDILVYLDQNMFQRIAAGGIDSALDMYHPHATYTLTVHDFKVVCKTNAQDKKVVQDLSRFRQKQEDFNRNMITSSHVNRGAIGRAKVSSQLTDTLYPRSFQVLHELDPNADIQMMSQGVKMPTVLATLHGVMKWKHVNQAAEDPHLNAASFDRTLTLINDAGRWLITNDMVHLRKHRGDAILLPLAASRLEKIGRRYNLPADFIGVACSMASSDSELFPILNDMQLPTNILQMCSQVSNNDLKLTILVARMVANLRLTPQAAALALAETGGDLAKGAEIAAQKYAGPEHHLS